MENNVGNTPERLKGTKTEENLHTALSGESQAYVRYKWFGKKAKSDGYVEISDIFKETSKNEREHAEIWFKCLGGLGTTEENLNTAAGGEHFEWSKMYKEFEETARAEGFLDIAELFSKVAAIEKAHEERFVKYLNNVRNGTSFKGEEDSTWICLNCGHVASGKEPPMVCPVCKHEKGYFKKQCKACE